MLNMPRRLAGEPPQDRTLDLCFVSHFAYDAMTGGSTGHIGGVERQTSLMARWLRSIPWTRLECPAS